MLRRSSFVPVARIGRSVPEARCSAGGAAPIAVSAMLLGFQLATPALGASPPLPKVGIPQPCGTGACGGRGSLPFIQGSSAIVVNGKVVAVDAPSWNPATGTLTVNQNAAQVILNWSGFNIAAGNSVVFQQPTAASVALNNIYQGSPSQILGHLSANGQVYLINQNGIVFGNGAQVSVGGLLASSLTLDPSNFLTGSIFAPATQNVPLLSDGGQAAGPIVVQQGATLATQPSGSGRIFLAGPVVINAGAISAPNGQVILAAGGQIYVQAPASSDQTTRGLIITIDQGTQGANAFGAPSTVDALGQPLAPGATAVAAGTAINTASGSIRTTHGNITLAGLTVNQNGQLNATTSVDLNGSIYLSAGAAPVAADTSVSPQFTQGGTLTLGPGSATAVRPDVGDQSTAVDTQVQLPGTINLSGRNVALKPGASVAAPGGQVNVSAYSNLLQQSLQPQAVPNLGNGVPVSNQGSIIVDAGASIDVSGTQDVAVPVTRNFVQAQLLGNELQDAPLQRNGFLYQKDVTIDVRGVNGSGDIPIANVAGYVASIGRTVAERTAIGGTVNLDAGSTVALRSGSSINLSGGYLNYQGGYAATTELLGADGKVYNIMTAPANLQYVGFAGGFTQANAKWGTSTTWQGLAGSNRVYVPGYLEGRDAGTLAIDATQTALDGTLLAQTLQGPNQRKLVTGADPTLSANWPIDPNSGQPIPPANLSALYYVQAPLGGTLNLGSIKGNVTQDAVITQGPANVTAALSDAQILATGLATGTAPASNGSTTYVPLAALVQSGFTRFNLTAADAITLAAPTDPNPGSYLPPSTENGVATSLAGYLLAPGSTLALNADRITLNAGVTTPGGTISAVAAQNIPNQSLANTALVVANGADFNVAGQWVNDSPSQPNPNLSALKDINGGSITLTSQKLLELGTGGLLTNQLDVSAGAYLSRGNALSAGTAGAITISAASSATAAAFEGGATYLGYGFSGGNTYTNAGSSSAGGSLSLSVPDLRIGTGTAAAGETLLGPGFLAQGGFAKYALTSQSNLLVDPGQVDALAQNLVAGNRAALNPTGTSIGSVASVALLPGNLRNNPVSLSLAVSQPFGAGAGTVSVSSGAVIATDPRGSISLSSLGSLYVDGTLDAPSGTISLTLKNPGASTYDPTQSLWLGANARLLAPETAQVTPNAQGLLQGGLVNDGGNSVSLLANHGSLIALPGSVIDISGTSTVIDQAQSSNGGAVATTLVGSAGKLTVASPVAIALGSTINARSGGATGAGGTLSVDLDAGLAAYGDLGAPPVNVGQLTLSANTTTSVPPGLSFGSAQPLSLIGQGTLSAAAIQSAGFSNVSLQAPSQVLLSGSPNLSVGGSISFNTPTLGLAPGASATVQAPVVTLSTAAYPGTPAATPGGATLPASASLTVHADELDVTGNVAIAGAVQTTLQSQGAIRLSGLPQSGQLPSALTSNEVGSLAVGGNLTLDAAQVYPSTSTSFTVNAFSAIQVSNSSGVRLPLPLSAAGSLALQAQNIVQNGVLAAPFGVLSLNASQTLTLGANSTTSVSAAGVTIPFGTTVNGNSWYGPDSNNLLTGAPAKSIALKAGGALNVAAGAVLDVAGGGDLLAYESVIGPGGSKDVLAGGNIYAILPGTTYATGYAPSSLDAANATPPGVGQAVYLSAGPAGAGLYTLLPAHDALLPGAYAVALLTTPAPIPGLSLAQADGSTLVAGKSTSLNTGYQAAQWSTWQILPASTIHADSQLNLSLASRYFPSQATLSQTPVGGVPADAGDLQLSAGTALALSPAAKVDFQPAAGGQGGEADFSAQAIAVVSTVNPANTALAGYLQLQASAVDSLGAARLVIGGTVNAQTGVLTVGASKVEVSNDASSPLSAPDLVLAASQSLTIAAGSSLSSTTSSATAATAISTIGDGAVIRLTDSSLPGFTRTPGTTSTAVLTIASGTTPASTTALAANGSLLLDSAGTTLLASSAVLASPTLRVDANTINLGAAPAGASGVSLVNATLGQAQELVLQTPNAINLYGPVSVGTSGKALTSLTLDTPVIDLIGPGQREIDAGSITVQSSTTGVGTTAQAAGSSTLTLHATTLTDGSGGVLTLGTGSVISAGTGLIQLTGDKAVVTEGSGALATQGSIGIATPVLQAAGGSDYTLNASGTLRLTPGTTPAAQLALGAGGVLDLRGQYVNIATTVSAPAGQIAVVADGAFSVDNVRVTPLGALDAAGYSKSFAGGPTSTATSAAADAGTVSLSSSNGSVLLDAGSQVNVSAAAGAAAGTIQLAAAKGTVSLGGTLSGQAAAGGAAGSLIIDTAGLAPQAGSAAGLSSLLAAQVSGGFAESFSLRVRSGNLDIAAGTTLAAHTLTLEADQGSVTLAGTLSVAADSHHSDAGAIAVWAGNSLALTGGRLDASAPAGAAGTITLGLASNSAGTLSADAASSINLTGSATSTQPGSLWLRVPQNAAGTGVAIGGFTTSLLGAPSVTIEGVRTYQVSGVEGSLLTNTGPGTPIGDANLFATNQATIVAGLGTLGSVATVLPGIEFDITGNGSLAAGSGLDLSTTRFGTSQAPGVLTLRASGALAVSGTLSDGISVQNGVATTSGTGSYVLTGPSWSYRLVAGADLTSANPLAVVPNLAAASLSFGPDSLVRTGTGSITMAAAGNISFGSGASIYTVGQLTPFFTTGPQYGPGNAFVDANGNLEQYTSGGGNISLTAGGSVQGSGSAQVVNDWLFRQTSAVSTIDGVTSFSGGNLAQTSWWTDYPSFQMNVGTLGGGNLTVAAGGNVSNLSAALPTNGRQGGGDGSGNPTAQDLQVLGGGNLSVTAGGSIQGGSYYVEQGSGTLRAAGSITTGSAATAPYAPVLGLGNAQLKVEAGGDLSVAAAYNPFLVPQSVQSVGQQAGAGEINVTEFGLGYFTTYTAASSLALVSAGGNATLGQGLGTLASSSVFNSQGPLVQVNKSNLASALSVLPPTLSTVAFGGDVNLDSSFTLSPAPSGNLSVLAGRSVALTSGSTVGARITLSNLDPSTLPAPDNPALQESGLFSAAVQDSTPLHGADTAGSNGSGTANGATTQPITLIADTGSIVGVAGAGSLISSSKPAVLAAGLDITGVSVAAQNLRSTDVTAVSAGRDITISPITSATSSGGSATITVAGPGELVLAAGRNIDLGSSNGVFTRTNGYQSTGQSGAGVQVYAGLGACGQRACSPQFATFATDYIDPSGPSSVADGNAALLQSYMAQQTGNAGISIADAWSRFEQLTPALQAPLVNQVLANELDITALQHNVHGDNYARGYAAIGTLFPGAVINAASGQALAYANQPSSTAATDFTAGTANSGDISLVYSQIRTLNGGAVDLLSPFGGVDVGLANPPKGVTPKQPFQLGVVTQDAGAITVVASSSINVNTSRVFTVGGGDITMWSGFGNVDAGRGAKSVVLVPPPVVTIDPLTGAVAISTTGATNGSGIGALLTSPNQVPGNVNLIAPVGIVDAGDAGIRAAGNLDIAAQTVLNAANIQVGGSSTGVPASEPVPITSPPAASSSSRDAANASEALAKQLADSAQNSEALQNAFKPTIVTVDVLPDDASAAPCDDKDPKRKCRKP